MDEPDELQKPTSSSAAASSLGTPAAASAPSGSSPAIREEETVWGIACADPDILKATHWVLTSVSITAFLLVFQVLAETEEEETTWDLVESVWWALDVLMQIVMVFAGYMGVKQSSRPLLGTFWILSLFCAVESAVEVCVMLYKVFSGHSRRVASEKASIPFLLALGIFEVAFYAVGVHFGRFLWREAAKGTSLHHRDNRPVRSSYEMMGIPVLNLKVLRATQSIFTALGLTTCILGDIVLKGAGVALKDESFRFWWLLCLITLVVMFGCGYLGVKRSSLILLWTFAGVTMAFFICILFLALALILAIFGCDATKPDSCPGPSLLWFSFGLLCVLGTALANTQLLIREVQSGRGISAIEYKEPADSNVVIGAPVVQIAEGTPVAQGVPAPHLSPSSGNDAALRGSADASQDFPKASPNGLEDV